MLQVPLTLQHELMVLNFQLVITCHFNLSFIQIITIHFQY